MKSSESEPVRRAATPSDPSVSNFSQSSVADLGATISARLRRRRENLIGNAAIGGADFGIALAQALDDALVELAPELGINESMAIAAAGSYARRELAPGSDIDVMLIHEPRADRAAVAVVAEALWYPLWDAGFLLGHGVRTADEAIDLAKSDLDALTTLLEIRLVAGEQTLVSDLRVRARRLAHRQRKKIIEQLSAAAANRADHPGPVAEMLEPNLKDGAGGLRDIDALGWAAASLDGNERGLDALVDAGALESGDPKVLSAARNNLLNVRLALHRTTGGRSDSLILQEQDAVAERLSQITDSASAGITGYTADDLVRALARSSRSVTWITNDVWRRLAPSSRRSRKLRFTRFPGVVEQSGAVAITDEGVADATSALRAATAAAEIGQPLQRATLEKLRATTVAPLVWSSSDLEVFIDLLKCGHAAVAVIEALDQVGVMTALIPEWEHVRALPQRNAYHRFTVDRHLLECVAKCAEILNEPGFDGEVARRGRPDLLLLGALLHDIAKGYQDDHSVLGADMARAIGTRMGLDTHGVNVLEWLVKNHLLLADTATRRDLAAEETIVRFGRAVKDTERLDLLYALTVGDSRATGPAAWSSGKAALVRQLFAETDLLFESGVTERRLEVDRIAALDEYADLLTVGAVGCSWRQGHDGLLECAVVAPDQPGLLAQVAEVLAVHQFDIRTAAAYRAPEGMALEVYRGVDLMGRLNEIGKQALADDLVSAIAGKLDTRSRLAERRNRSLLRRDHRQSTVQISFDLEASRSATVLEVEAFDESGMLARIARAISDLGLDVSAAFVSTLGDRVIDVFYLRDQNGAKPTEPAVLDNLRQALETALADDQPTV